LSSLKFPADARQLHVQDGVIIANPARVLALVQMLRRHTVQVHTLRLSNVERDSKTDALYEFIRSERCCQLFARIDDHAESLLKLQAQEKKAHDTTWKQPRIRERGSNDGRQAVDDRGGSQGADQGDRQGGGESAGGNGDGGRESQSGAEGDSDGWGDDGGRSQHFIRS
jgi:hypothetical protein